MNLYFNANLQQRTKLISLATTTVCKIKTFSKKLKTVIKSFNVKFWKIKSYFFEKLVMEYATVDDD